MGQIHLFASTLTPVMRDFLVEYQDGKLHPVAMARVLDDNPYPHAQMVVAKLEYNYILVEFTDPMQWKDLDWLQACIIEKRFEFDRRSAKRYSIDRTLGTIPGQHGRRIVETEEQWESINHFRRLLELPALALKLLDQTYAQGSYLLRKRCDCETIDGSAKGRVLMIEYAGEMIEQRQRRREATVGR